MLTRGDDVLTAQSVPGVHALGVMKALLPPVMGTVLTWVRSGVRQLSLYLTGDTMLGDHIAAILQRHPQLDGAVVHLGGTRVLGALVTLDGESGRGLLEAVRPGYAVPVHHDDYGVFRSPLSDFTRALAGTPYADRVRYVERGATISLAPEA